MVEFAACSALSGSVAADSVDHIVVGEIPRFWDELVEYSQRWFSERISAQIIAGAEESNACRNGSLNSSMVARLIGWTNEQKVVRGRH